MTKHSYQIKDLAELFDAKPAAIKALFNNILDASRATELRSQFQAAGPPATSQPCMSRLVAVNSVMKSRPLQSRLFSIAVRYCQVTLHRGLIQSVEDIAPTTVKAIQQET
jgi:hypothetical protein